MDKASLKFVFGEVAEYSLEVYRRIRQEICNNKYQYIFYSNEGFISEALKNGPGWTNQYYCMEILQRIYLTVVLLSTSLVFCWTIALTCCGSVPIALS